MSSIATSVPRTQPPSVRPRSEKSNAPPTRVRSGANASAKSRSLSALISQKTLIVTIRTILSKAPKTPETNVKGNWRSAGTLDCSEASACPASALSASLRGSLASNACCASLIQVCACVR